jgi:hypothetical protein
MRELTARLQRRPVTATALALVVTAALVVGGRQGPGWIGWWLWSRQAERITSVHPVGRPAVSAVLTYQYREKTRSLTVPISAEELAADRDVRTDVIFGQRPELKEAYLRTLVDAQSHAPSVVAVVRQLRAVRSALRLDGDEYVELMASAVQDIPYGTPRPAFPLPAQTLAERRGVCVDKSVLLAAMLVHEGYDVGVWSLSAEHHVAVAIHGVGGGYRGTGYAFVETTRRAYIGEVPEDYAAAAQAQPRPDLARVGGGRRYRADPQTALILDERQRAEQTARRLEPYRRFAAEGGGSKWYATYEREARRQMAASALASMLTWSSDDRRVAFATLESVNGWSRPNETL